MNGKGTYNEPVTFPCRSFPSSLMPGSAPNSAVRSNTFNPHFPPHELSLPPPPQVVAHHVWLLDCSHCGTFITNRGMKVCLLGLVSHGRYSGLVRRFYFSDPMSLYTPPTPFLQIVLHILQNQAPSIPNLNPPLRYRLGLAIASPKYAVASLSFTSESLTFDVLH